MTDRFDVVVVGGGLLGSAVGFGLADQGLKTAIVDQGDTAYRAARGNFGLVWVQSKGVGYPPYANWTMRSAELWPQLAARLLELTGLDVALQQPGGLHICLSEAEMEDRRTKLERLAAHQEGRFKYEMLGRNAVAAMVPGIGPEVVGASFCPHDGHVNPLRLMRALQDGFAKLGGRMVIGATVSDIATAQDGFRISAGERTLTSTKVVLAAGLGNRALAPLIGLDQPVRPVKGQVLVTERITETLDFPVSQLRQTDEGTIMLGSSEEEVGFDVSTTADVVRRIADRARRAMPALADVNIVRTWAALRVMTPDGFPIYDQSEQFPGAFAMSCHSGVTLAAAHALVFARDVAAGELSEDLSGLSRRRFDVPSSQTA